MMLAPSMDSSSVATVIQNPGIESSGHWSPVCHITYSRDSWVKLLIAPSDYSFDQALLLCPESTESNEKWLAWIPDHGETILDRSNIYC